MTSRNSYTKYLRKDNQHYKVYMVECSDKTIYTGIAKDVDRRMGVHRRGKGSKYIRARLPILLKWESEWMDKSSALKEERRIKSLTRQSKLNHILHYKCLKHGKIKYGRKT